MDTTGGSVRSSLKIHLRTAGVTLIAAGFLATLGVGRSTTAAPAAIAWPADELIALTNMDRTSNGLAALLVDQQLMDVAQSRSDDMLARGYFDHDIPPDGHSVFDVLRGLGRPGLWGGENLHRNNLPRAQSVSYAERALMSSPDHRANVLESTFDSVGVGAAYEAESGRSIYTVLFARLEAPGAAPQSAPAPPPASASGVTSPRQLVPLTGAPRGLVDALVQRTLRGYLGL